MAELPRIVITGVGLTSPNGNSLEEYRANLLAGVSGVRRKEITHLGETLAGSCDFDVLRYQKKKELRRGTRSGSVAIWCTHEALRSGEPDLSSYDPGRIGIYIGITEQVDHFRPSAEKKRRTTARCRGATRSCHDDPLRPVSPALAEPPERCGSTRGAVRRLPIGTQSSGGAWSGGSGMALLTPPLESPPNCSCTWPGPRFTPPRPAPGTSPPGPVPLPIQPPPAHSGPCTWPATGRCASSSARRCRAAGSSTPAAPPDAPIWPA